MEKDIQTIIKYAGLLSQTEYEYWTDNVVFTPSWWVLIAFLIIPWILWYTLVDKKHMLEILLYYFFMSGSFLIFDEIGNTLTLWAYPIKVMPLFPRLMPMCCSLTPVVYSLLYQYFRKWSSFTLANVFASAVLSLIVLPLAAQWSFIVLLNWKYIYSTIIFSIVSSISKLFVDLANNIEYKAAA